MHAPTGTSTLARRRYEFKRERQQVCMDSHSCCAIKSQANSRELKDRLLTLEDEEKAQLAVRKKIRALVAEPRSVLRHDFWTVRSFKFWSSTLWESSFRIWIIDMFHVNDPNFGREAAWVARARCTRSSPSTQSLNSRRCSAGEWAARRRPRTRCGRRGRAAPPRAGTRAASAPSFSFKHLLQLHLSVSDIHI